MTPRTTIPSVFLEARFIPAQAPLDLPYVSFTRSQGGKLMPWPLPALGSGWGSQGFRSFASFHRQTGHSDAKHLSPKRRGTPRENLSLFAAGAALEAEALFLLQKEQFEPRKNAHAVWPKILFLLATWKASTVPGHMGKALRCEKPPFRSRGDLFNRLAPFSATRGHQEFAEGREKKKKKKKEKKEKNMDNPKHSHQAFSHACVKYPMLWNIQRNRFCLVNPPHRPR